jgi:threonyl-tRNA synthetase
MNARQSELMLQYFVQMCTFTVDAMHGQVITPNIFNLNLWRTSGHLDMYAENMFLLAPKTQQDKGGDQSCGLQIAVESEGKDFSMNLGAGEMGLKPMNCPGHCLLFGSSKR